MRVTLIYNPSAGDESGPTRGQLEALIQHAGHEVRYLSVKRKGWRRGLEKPADLIVIAGGDGTVGKVARRMIGSAIPMAILPIGTANNISRSIGIADLSVLQLIPSWKSSRRLTFDAGVAAGPWGKRHFIEGIGLGLFASAMPKIDANETMAELSDTEIKLTYTVQMLRDHLDVCKAEDVSATLDGEDISGRYLLFEAMLMKFVGPNLHIAPDVRRADGLFDVVMVAERDRKRLHRHLAKWQEGTLWPAELRTVRGKHLVIEWTGFPMHVDDKVWPGPGDETPRPPVPAEITVERKAFQLLVPKRLGAPSLNR